MFDSHCAPCFVRAQVTSGMHARPTPRRSKVQGFKAAVWLIVRNARPAQDLCSWHSHNRLSSGLYFGRDVAPPARGMLAPYAAALLLDEDMLKYPAGAAEHERKPESLTLLSSGSKQVAL